jgi:hypothetical protein
MPTYTLVKCLTANAACSGVIPGGSACMHAA